MYVQYIKIYPRLLYPQNFNSVLALHAVLQSTENVRSGEEIYYFISLCEFSL